MKLKITFAILFVTILGLSACNKICVKGSGNVVTKERVLTHFNELDMSGGYKVELTQDSVQKVEIITDDNLQDHVKTTVNGDKLVVKSDKNLCPSGSILVKIHIKELSKLEASGAVDVKTTNVFKQPSFELKTSGATESDLMMNVNTLSTRISGAGKITLRGQAAEYDIKISGAGKIKAFDLVANKCTVDISGAGDSEVNVLSELNVSASGASKVSYKGSPTKVVENSSGASSVKKVE